MAVEEEEEEDGEREGDDDWGVGEASGTEKVEASSSLDL